MLTILSAGSSFNNGLGLHFYDRYHNGLPLNYMLSPSEYAFNHNHSYHAILANKLNGKSIAIPTGGEHNTFLTSIDSIKDKINNDTSIKIVLFQLINAERDFFIYNNEIYKIDFTDIDSFYKSKDILLSTLDIKIKDDFETKLNESIELYIKDTKQWKYNHSLYFIDKLNKLYSFLKEKNIEFKIMCYYEDFVEQRHHFNDDIFITFKHNDIEYTNIQALVTNNMLRINDDISITTDEHPNFKAHEIVANNILESLNNSYL